MSHPSDFFTAGGTLRARAPSYVTRPADRELLEHTLAGEFCYVLTPRQMGKSSLMIRTAQQLAEAGRKVAILDLNGIGSGTADEWYLGLLTNISRELRLSADVPSWWQKHASLAIPQRFGEFLREIVLQQIAGPIVIFVDEIDSTLNLDFRDDFFAAIRAIYNARAAESAYKRLTFALLGVATPTDLIRDRNRTPFNIGRRIVLQEFSYDEASSLLAGLEACHPGQGDAILYHIFNWTNGHPYLTQKLCLAATERPAAHWDTAQVDELAEAAFFSEAGRKDPNFKDIQQRIHESSLAERRQMLKLYRKVYSGKEMRDDDRSQSQNHLELYGLVRVVRGNLSVRNDIYRRIFDAQWIEANTPANRDLRWAIGASMIALLAIVALWLYIRQTPSPSASLYIKQFNDNAFSTARIEALAGLFGLRDGLYDRDDEQGLNLFYGLNSHDQLALFSEANARSKGREMVAAIRRISLTLDEQDADDLAIMGEMITALDATGQPGADTLAEELTIWKHGRELAENGQYQDATAAYSTTLQLNPDNLAARYDQASVLVQMKRYGEALGDFNQIIVIAKTTAPLPTAIPTATFTPTAALVATGALLASPGVEVPTRPPSPGIAAASITATALITVPLPAGASNSRFTEIELIIKTVADTIRGNEDLMSYLRDSQNQIAYQELSQALDLSSLPDATLVATATTSKTAMAAQQLGALVQQLKNNDPQVRGASVISLTETVVNQPAFAPQAVEALLPLLRDPISQIRAATVSSLAQILRADSVLATPDITAALLPILTDADANVRIAAASSVGQIGAINPPLITTTVVSQTSNLLADHSGPVRAAAVAALAQMVTAKPSLALQVGSSLRTLAQDTDSNVRVAVEAALKLLEAEGLIATEPLTATPTSTPTRAATKTPTAKPRQTPRMTPSSVPTELPVLLPVETPIPATVPPAPEIPSPTKRPRRSPTPLPPTQTTGPTPEPPTSTADPGGTSIPSTPAAETQTPGQATKTIVTTSTPIGGGQTPTVATTKTTVATSTPVRGGVTPTP